MKLNYATICELWIYMLYMKEWTERVCRQQFKSIKFVTADASFLLRLNDKFSLLKLNFKLNKIASIRFHFKATLLYFFTSFCYKRKSIRIYLQWDEEAKVVNKFCFHLLQRQIRAGVSTFNTAPDPIMLLMMRNFLNDISLSEMKEFCRQLLRLNFHLELAVGNDDNQIENYWQRGGKDAKILKSSSKYNK